MTTNSNKRKETNLLFLKKDSNYNTSMQELNKISLNFHLNSFHKKNNSKTGRLYNHYNKITKVNNFHNKFIDQSIINTYIKTSSPTTNFKSSHIDISNNSNNDLSNKIKAKENLTSREYPKDKQTKKHFHHKKINSHLLINNNQILNELFPINSTSNSNKAKDSIFNNKKKSGPKILRKKQIEIDTYNINNNINNLHNISKKINTLLNNNNNPHKINLKIYLEKHQRILSTDSNKNNNKSIKKSSKNKKKEKCQNKNNINSVINNKRLITNKNSTRLLNNLNHKNITLSRVNSSWVKKEYNIFNTSLENSLSKKITKKNSNKVKINNVIVKNIKNFMKQKKLKINGNFEIKKNSLVNLNKPKEKSALYYLTNISEEIKNKKKNYNNGNNIFISINNYTEENRKKENKSNVNLTEGKDLNIQNYLSKKCISQKGYTKIRKRNHIKNGENKYKFLGESKNSSQNKTEENCLSYNSENDKNEGPETTHFFLVASIQKGIKNITNYK